MVGSFADGGRFAELLGAGTSQLQCPQPPGNPGREKSLGSSGRSPGSPFPAPRQCRGDKGWSCSWQGAVKGLLEEWHCAQRLLPPQDLLGPSMGALGSASTLAKHWGGICSAHSFISVQFS